MRDRPFLIFRSRLVTRSAHAETSPAPAVAGPVSRARKRIGSAKATAAQDRLIALVERGIAAVVVEALIGIGRAPASAGPRRLAPLRARPALGVSVGEQQSHYCDTEQNKTNRAHGSSPSLSFRRMLCDCSRYLAIPMQLAATRGSISADRNDVAGSP